MASTLISPVHTRSLPSRRAARDIARPRSSTTVFELAAAVDRGAVLVDMRTQSQRNREGTLPGALAIEADLLAARLDPAGPAPISLATGADVEWVVVSSTGVDAARCVVALRALGLNRATAVRGGYRAVRAAGLLAVATRSRHLLRETDTVVAH